MDKVARTDQLGRLIALAGKAIGLTQDGHRTTEAQKALIDHLQAYHDDKPYPPPSASTPTCQSCCGYPHYNDPYRPKYEPTQILHLCELTEGTRFKVHDMAYKTFYVTSKPMQCLDGKNWFVYARPEHETMPEAMHLGGLLVPERNNRWRPCVWLEFLDEPRRCAHQQHNAYY